MSTRRRRHDDGYERRDHRQSSSRGSGAGIWLLVGLVLFVWAKSGAPGASGGTVHHSPSHGSTVCTQYFKGGC